MQKLSVKEKVGYALGDTATNLTWRTLMVFLPIFYTDVFGLSAAAMGTLLLVCRFWDGITDLVMGIIADRTHSRWGKFRPWILWTALPFGIFTVLVFMTPDLGAAGKLVYAYVTYSVLIIVFTASNVPYSALMGVMTPDPADRTSISGYRFVFAFLGGLIVQGGLIPLVTFLGHGDDIKGYTLTMILFSILLVVFLLITFYTTRERIIPPPSQTGSILHDLKDLFNNKPWVVLFFVGILFVSFNALKQSAIMYYFTHYIGDKNLAVSYMIAILIASMAGAALTKHLTRLLDKKNLFIIAMTVSGLTCIPLYFLKPDHLTMIYIFGMISDFAGGPVVVLFFSMLGDCADYSEWKNRRRATGLTYSAGTVAMKFGSGFGGAVLGWVLASFGYVEGSMNTGDALIGIRLVMSIIPAILSVITIIVMWFYTLNNQLLVQMEQVLDAMRDTSGPESE